MAFTSKYVGDRNLTAANLTTKASRWSRTLGPGGIWNFTIEIDGHGSDLFTLQDQLAFNTSLSGTFSGTKVTRTTLKREGKGLMGTLVIEASSQTGVSGDATAARVQTEIEYQRVDQDIRNHPLFSEADVNKGIAAGEYALTSDQKREVEKYFNDTDLDPAALSASQRQLYDRLRRQQLSYMVFVPVVRKTTEQASEPTPQAIGQIDTGNAVSAGGPSQNANGKSYRYIKMADSKSKQNYRWTRREEWVGFIDVDQKVIENT